MLIHNPRQNPTVRLCAYNSNSNYICLAQVCKSNLPQRDLYSAQKQQHLLSSRHPKNFFFADGARRRRRRRGGLGVFLFVFFKAQTNKSRNKQDLKSCTLHLKLRFNRRKKTKLNERVS